MADNYDPKFEKLMAKWKKQSRDIQSDSKRFSTKADKKKDKERKSKERKLKNGSKNR